MRICSLGILAKPLLVAALSLVLAACGTSSQQSNKQCSGCSFLYATTNANEILTFQLNSSGALSAPASSPGVANSPDVLGSTFSLGGPLYVSDPNGAVDAYTVSGSNGTLTTLMGSPFSTGGPAGSPGGLLTFGNYLYAGNTNGTVSAFSIGANGALAAIRGSPFEAGAAPLNLAATTVAGLSGPSISVLYAADFTGGGIWGFTINSDGSLQTIPGSPFQTPLSSAPSQMLVSSNANGGTLYVALSGLNEIEAFNVVGLTGGLVPFSGSPFSTGRGPVSLFGFASFAYALNSLDHTISAYSMDPNTGLLTGVQGSPFAAGTATGGMINDTRNASIFYVPDVGSNEILAFTADNSTGSLAPLAGSPFATGSGPIALTTVAFPVVDPP